MERIANIRRIVVLFTVLSFLAAAGFTYASDPLKVNINEASAQELVKLKGIGKKYAERIVEYRKANGKFEKIEDIMNVKGIGKKKYEKIKDLIIVKNKK